MLWLGDCQNEVERTTEETRTTPSPPASGAEWMDEIFLEEEEMFGRGGGEFIFGFSEVFKASCFHGLGFCTDPLLPILPDQMCTIYYKRMKQIKVPIIIVMSRVCLHTTHFAFFNVKIFFHKHLYEM